MTLPSLLLTCQWANANRYQDGTINDDAGVLDNQITQRTDCSSVNDSSKRSSSLSQVARTSPLRQQPKISNTGQLGSGNVVSSRTVLQAMGMKVRDKP